MRLGIDFGTTRVVVAAADRGNYPVITFEGDGGEACEWYPSLCALRGNELRTGHAAAAVLRESNWQIGRSLKRLLSHAVPEDRILGLPLMEVLTRFLVDLKTSLMFRSNLQADPEDQLEVAIAVPANATANQRLLTCDAFAAAGFSICRIVDEPSAAGLEYAWRRATDAKVRRRHVAVYDLGGGTFDASIISMGDALHEVITTEGVERLGGDDFDEVLLSLALQSLGEPLPDAGPERDRLLEICRSEKERFTTSTRRLRPDLFQDGREVSIPVAEYEEALRPLIHRSLETLDLALNRAGERVGDDLERCTVVYQVGGASQLPTVSRVLKERFGRRVWRSPYAHASVAVGLAIAVEENAGERLRQSFTRHFGVWRETDNGRAAYFDAVFPKDTPIPTAENASPLTVVRRYWAAHNVGHFRFVECSRVCENGAPAGNITPWREVRFPMIGELRDTEIDGLEVQRLPSPFAEIEERYHCDSNGTIEVELANLTEGYQQTYRLHGRAA